MPQLSDLAISAKLWTKLQGTPAPRIFGAPEHPHPWIQTWACTPSMSAGLATTQRHPIDSQVVVIHSHRQHGRNCLHRVLLALELLHLQLRTDQKIQRGLCHGSSNLVLHQHWWENCQHATFIISPAPQERGRQLPLLRNLETPIIPVEHPVCCAGALGNIQRRRTSLVHAFPLHPRPSSRPLPHASSPLPSYHLLSARQSALSQRSWLLWAFFTSSFRDGARAHSDTKLLRNSSLRNIISSLWVGFAALRFSGETDTFKKLRVKFTSL